MVRGELGVADLDPAGPARKTPNTKTFSAGQA